MTLPIRQQDGCSPEESLTMVLRSSTDEYEKLHEAIYSFGRRHGYSSRFLSVLDLTLKEAFVNAVRHGNLEQDTSPVTIRFRVDSIGMRLLVTVSDCGKGFRPDDLYDPTGSELQGRLTGRGVYIIRAYAEIVGAQADDSGFSLTLGYAPE